MSRLPNISIRLHGAIPARACVELAVAADAAGLAGVWFAENAFARGIFPAAAACAVATRRLQINAGVFNPFSRHPTMMGMEIGALDELAEGRVTATVGSGIQAAATKMGLDASKPLPAMRDTLTILRGLLRGETVEYSGAAFSAKGVKLDFSARRDIPIYLAGRGDLTVRLAGQSADGVIVSNMCTVGYSGRIARDMRESRVAAGHAGDGLVAQYMPCAVGKDGAAARRAARHAVAEMLPGFWTMGQRLPQAKAALMTGAAFSDQDVANAVVRLRGGEDPAAVLDDRFVDAFSLAGTPDQCLQSAARFAEAGISELALTFTGPMAAQEIAALGAALAGWRR